MHQSISLCLAIIIFFTPLSSADDHSGKSMQSDEALVPPKTLHDPEIVDKKYINPDEEHSTTPIPVFRPSDIVSFSKLMYSSLASGNAAMLAERFRSTFDSLNQDEKLGETLDIMYDMRLMDLQASIRHARKMKDVIELLKQPN